MAQAIGKSLPSWDWATNRRYSSEVSLLLAPARLIRYCADRASTSAVAARGPGLFPSRRLDQAANTPAASHAARRAGNLIPGRPVRRSTDLSCRHRPSPVISVTARASLPGKTDLGALQTGRPRAIIIESRHLTKVRQRALRSWPASRRRRRSASPHPVVLMAADYRPPHVGHPVRRNRPVTLG